MKWALLVVGVVLLAGCTTNSDQELGSPNLNRPADGKAGAVQPVPPTGNVSLTIVPVPSVVVNTTTVTLGLTARKEAVDGAQLVVRSTMTGVKDLKVGGEHVRVVIQALAGQPSDIGKQPVEVLAMSVGVVPLEARDYAAFMPPAGTRSVLVTLDGLSDDVVPGYVLDWQTGRWYEGRWWDGEPSNTVKPMDDGFSGRIVFKISDATITTQGGQ